MQTIFLVSTHLWLFVVLDEYFLSNTHVLCCSGKTPERKEFQERACWTYCGDLFLLPLLEAVSFCLFLFIFLKLHMEECFWQRGN